MKTIFKKSFFYFCITILITIFSFSQSTTNLAQWKRYPAVSPDGTQIVFSYQGDLFIVPTEGGKPIQLTRHEAYDFNPVWSPDGKYIAFASDRFGNFDLFIIPANGGKSKRLTFHSASDIPSGWTSDSKYILFSSSRMDSVKSSLFPSGVLPELYKVNIKGGLPVQVLTTPAIDAQINKNGTKILYHDQKGYEIKWRKHHTSSIARDVWLYDIKTGKHTKLTVFSGEDRNPVWNHSEQKIYYLSEKSGSFNVWEMDSNNPRNIKQITFFKKNPVRFLSISKNNILCFGYNGDIFIKKPGEKPQKVNTNLNIDYAVNPVSPKIFMSEATEIALSPNGKEIAFIVRGEVFVTSVDFSDTKRITHTSGQERSVSFSPDGKKLLFAGEINDSWNLYEAMIVRKDEPYFYASTLIKVKPLLVTKQETFQPAYSPDGKKVAFLEDRTTLRVMDLKTKKIITVLSGDKNYSYSDGDQWFKWSPDSKWLLVTYLDKERYVSEAGLVDATGKKPVINLTNSGYNDVEPRWTMKGNMMIWASDMMGYRSHGSWGSEYDIYGMFFNKKTFDKFKLSKSDYELFKEREKKLKKKKSDKKDKKDLKKGEKKKTNIQIDLKNIEDRIVRLTVRSSNILDFGLTPDGKTLVYISGYKKGYAIWTNKIREKKVKLLTKLSSWAGSMIFDKKGKNIFLLSRGGIIKVNIQNGRIKPISFRAQINLNYTKEKQYIFEHVWRQVKEKLYDAKLQGVDWDYYKKNYAKFIPSITNNYDFAELLSEMLGELNVSHTGSGYSTMKRNRDSTAVLGLFYDRNYKGDGLKIAEVIEKGPFDNAETKVKAGIIIKKINGVTIKQGMNYFSLLNHKAGKRILLTFYNPATRATWEEVVKPINLYIQNNLLYQRWVKTRRLLTEKLSHGKLGYVHIEGMTSGSFRKVFSEIMGRNYNKDGIIVDTRFNGGGWLHDDLVVLLSGKKYMTLYPRGRKIGIEPMNRWVKKSIVIVGESNYSDAHMFPYSYKELGIGKLVGMPVPGTGTAVWWETLQDPTIYFGIPQIGMLGNDGKYLENQQLYPDYQVKNDPESSAKGRDKQLEKAVEVLLKEK
jgi:Tol biopolymer transport system component